MLKTVRIALLATASLAAVGLWSGAQAQGVYLGPGGVGIDTGGGYDGARVYRRHREDGDFRPRHRFDRRDEGYDRHRMRDRYERGGERRHRRDFNQPDGEQ